jgi:uncharacterized protein
MKTVRLSDIDVQSMTMDIIRHMTLINYIPDYVVGITRGGLVPALLISQYYDKPMNTLRVSLRDHAEQECNAWMPEDAFGYKDQSYGGVNRKNILIVDDINDTGATIEWIKRDWESSCFPNERKEWDSIWHYNVKFAVLVNNEASNEAVDFCASFINTVNDPEWTIFPWESWWR